MNNFKSNKNKTMALISLFSLISGGQGCCAQDTRMVSENNQEIIDKLKNNSQKDDLSIAKKNIDDKNNIKIINNEFTLKQGLIIGATFTVPMSLLIIKLCLESRYNRIRDFCRSLNNFVRFYSDDEINISLFKPSNFDDYKYDFNRNNLLNNDSDICSKLYRLVTEISGVYFPSSCCEYDMFKAKKFAVEYLLENVAPRCDTIKNGKFCYSFKSNGDKFEIIFDVKFKTHEYRLMEIIVANHSKEETVGFKLEIKR